MNKDSIGVELVGEETGGVFVAVTPEQNTSLQWLVKEIAESFRVSMLEVYRHPEVSWKQPTEASTAKW